MQDSASTKIELQRLGAPQVLIDLASGTRAPGLLAYELNQPRIIYRALREAPDRLPNRGKLLPLWETNGDSITALIQSEPCSVIRYHFGDPPEETEHLGSSIQDALQHIINHLVADIGLDESRVQQAVESAGLPNAASMVASARALRDEG